MSFPRTSYSCSSQYSPNGSGGSHEGYSWERTGYCGFGRAVASLGLRTSTPLNIDYVVSTPYPVCRLIHANTSDLIHRLLERRIPTIYLPRRTRYPPLSFTQLSTIHKLTHRRRQWPDRIHPPHHPNQNQTQTRTPHCPRPRPTTKPLPRVLPLRNNRGLVPRRTEQRGHDLFPVELV